MNKQDLINKNIGRIELIFENCERVSIPLECFDKLILDLKDDKYVSKFKCDIHLSNDITYNAFGSRQTPLRRINEYNDITHIILIDKNNTRNNDYSVIWYDNDDFNYLNNCFQSSTLLSWNTLTLDIDSTKEIYVKPSEEQIKELLQAIVNTKFNVNKIDMSIGKMYSMLKEEYL